MEETKELHCSECGAKIEDNYYKCLDNCLQVNFFDTEEENCFCSEECFCKYMSLEQLDVEEKQLSIFDMEVLDNGKQRRNTGSTK